MTADERHAEETRRVDLDGQAYDCQAYGPRSRGYCFFDQVDECGSRIECVRALEGERLLMWLTLTVRANLGDRDSIAILSGLSSPEMLLNGEYWAGRDDQPWMPEH
jgi:hypothetical protein